MGIRLWTFAAIAAAAAALAACETMSAEECAAADWRGLGYADASERGAERLAERGESCAKRNIAADASAYQSGFESGLRVFCTPARGWRFARRGGVFRGTCPEDLEVAFRPAYLDGVRVHQAEQALQQARTRVASLELRRRDIDNDIESHEGALAEAKTDEERQRHRDDINRLTRERRRVNDDLIVAQAAVLPLDIALSRLRIEIGDRWGNWY